MHTTGLSPNSMSVYLSAVRSAHVMMGMQEPIIRSPQVKLALKAVKDSAGPPNQKMPITYDILKQMIFMLRGDREEKLWSAILSLAFFAGLRGAEYAAVSMQGHVTYPKLSSISYNIIQGAKVMQYTIHKSKTQVHAYSVPVGCTRVRVCAYCMIYDYIKVKFAGPVSPHMPLFTFHDKSMVYKSHVNFTIKRLLRLLGYDISKYTTHSLRAGAATTAASMGFTDWEIMRVGGWRSAAYRQYIRQVDSLVAGLSARLATTLN